jgi:hypothetical protein
MYNVKANSNLIQWETCAAFLVKLPRTKYKFWISKKLARETGHKLIMVIPDSFEIKIFNRSNEKILCADEFLEYFGFDFSQEIIDDLKD